MNFFVAQQTELRMMRSLLRRGPNKRSDRPKPEADLQGRFPDSTAFERELILATANTTMTSPERVLALIRAVDHVIKSEIAGAIVECGVWKGGSMFAAAKTLLRNHDASRQLWLYDTFEGMSCPTECDVDFLGRNADSQLANDDFNDPQGVWCVGPLNEVKSHIASSGYPENQINYVVGKVEETLLRAKPEQIALLRLDTDWYESTRCELTHLFPLLSPGGILIIDDYGHWAGCQRAVDEYFEANNIRMFLNRIDYTGRVGVKQA